MESRKKNLIKKSDIKYKSSVLLTIYFSYPQKVKEKKKKYTKQSCNFIKHGSFLLKFFILYDAKHKSLLR